MRNVLWAAVAGCAWGGAVLAAPLSGPLTGAEAQEMLFAAPEVVVELIQSPEVRKPVMKIIRAVAEQQPYYTAIALVPDEDIMASKATMAGAQFHDTDAAAAFALAGCEAVRTGAKPCVVVALVRPKGWTAREVQLSAAATAAFGETYLAADAPRAMATSASTGLWGFASGAGAAEAAVADCTAKAAEGTEVADCFVVIAD